MEEDTVVEEVVKLLPVIGRRLHAAVANHPFIERRTVPQLRVLIFLHRREHATISEIAAGVGAGLPAISEMVDRLVEDGSVERAVNPADRRQVLVRLTPRARAFGDRIHDIRRAQVIAALELLTPEQRPYLLPVVQALAEALLLESHELELASCPAVELPAPACPDALPNARTND